MQIVKPVLAVLLVLGGLAACAERTTGQKVRDTLDPPSGTAEAIGRSTDRTVDRVLGK